MVTLFEQPAKAMNPAYFSSNPYSRKLLSLGLTRYANQEPESVLRQLALLRSRFGLTQAEVKPVERAIVRRLLLDRS
ncbi:hypothetical protein OFN25_31655, partial [Escherichia coli]|nr:hypothetical protein [Escherichia coli]